MQLAELTALLIGGALALSVWVLASTCRSHSGRRLAVVRSLSPFVNTGLLGLAFTAPAAPGIRALAAVSFAITVLALSIELSAQRAEPMWWDSFESAFWRYLEHGAVGDEPV